MYVDALLALNGSITGNTVSGANIFGSGTTLVSANTIDLSTGNPASQVRDMGESDEKLFLRVEVTTAFAGGTSAEFQIIAADAANLTGNVTVLGTTGAIAVASLTAGARFVARINPRLANKGQRYLGMQCVNVGANSAGAVFADIGPDIQDGAKFYPSGFSVL
jgi:hypothetical protein